MRIRAGIAGVSLVALALAGCGSGEMAPGMPANAKIGEDAMPKIDPSVKMGPKDQTTKKNTEAAKPSTP
jgi:hypothetical protein